jgi:lipopolysaccharide transport system ATP-binding protein
MSISIKVENLSKAYQIGQFGTGTISHDLNRWWALKRGKEDPYLRIGEENDRSKKGGSNIVWSLNDVNFEIKQGDTVGIIGKNGAGKSTLLKILSQITAPTSGFVKIRGRAASLLEVGTGFHPELTGRENIYLNGTILGMRKHEIKEKFDEIVDFSGVERYIDTPVKRYSSGMYVRLAFAVAAHLESEILIVDEVLAVGDAEFQSKCLNKMEDISRGMGRTILFVSHNLPSIKKLCKHGILLTNGELNIFDKIENVTEAYTNSGSLTNSKIIIDSKVKRRGTGQVKFVSFEILNSNKLSDNEFSIGDDVCFSFCVENILTTQICQIGIEIVLPDGIVVYHFINKDSGFLIKLDQGKTEFRISLTDIRLYPNLYSLTISISDEFGSLEFDHIPSLMTFSILDGKNYTNRILPYGSGIHFLNPKWEKIV